jgi:hypothetical protein
VAITNQERIRKAMDLLRQGLAPFVDREVQSAVKVGAVRMDAVQRFAEDRMLGKKPIAQWDAAGLLAAMSGQSAQRAEPPTDTQASAARARAIVTEIERSLGFEPTDRETEKLGYDIESRVPGTGRLRFIEVKGRVAGAPNITVTKNEIVYSLNKPEDLILAIVEFFGDETHEAHYLRQPFGREPDFGVTSVNYDFAELLARAEPAR